MDERNFSTPGWVTTFYAVDAVVGVLLVAGEVYLILRFLKKRKASAA